MTKLNRLRFHLKQLPAALLLSTGSLWGVDCHAVSASFYGDYGYTDIGWYLMGFGYLPEDIHVQPNYQYEPERGYSPVFGANSCSGTSSLRQIVRRPIFLSTTDMTLAGG